MSRSSSPSNRFGALLDDDEEISEERQSPQQPQPRPLRTITPNTRTAYAARASARRAALRDSIPDESPSASTTGPRPSFADVLAGVAASAAPQNQTEEQIPIRTTPDNAESEVFLDSRRFFHDFFVEKVVLYGEVAIKSS